MTVPRLVRLVLLVTVTVVNSFSLSVLNSHQAMGPAVGEGGSWWPDKVTKNYKCTSTSIFMNIRLDGSFVQPQHRGSGTLPYITQPPSRHQTFTDTSLEKEKLKLHLYHTLLIKKYGIFSE